MSTLAFSVCHIKSARQFSSPTSNEEQLLQQQNHLQQTTMLLSSPLSVTIAGLAVLAKADFQIYVSKLRPSASRPHN